MLTKSKITKVLPIFFLGVGVLLASCSSNKEVSTKPAIPIESTSSIAISPSGIKVKPLIYGFIDMGVQSYYQKDLPFPTVDTSQIDNYVGAFAGIVINENWATLEPVEGEYQWAPLDTSLSAVSEWNKEHLSDQVSVKLRIFAGNGAPLWAKNIGGAPFTVTTSKFIHTYGRWWSAQYRQAWSDFQHVMATRYDSNPLIREVSIASCTSLTGEPFVLSANSAPMSTIEAAGWTPQAQQSCLNGALSDYSGWKQTSVTFAINQFFNRINGSKGENIAITQNIMEACVNSLQSGGPQCLLGNNDLSSQAPTGFTSWVYNEIGTLVKSNASAKVYFQTVGAGIDCPGVNTAITYHASSVELWPPNGKYKGYAQYSPSTISQWASALKSGKQISC